MKKINSEKKNKLIENSILVGIYSFTVWYILVFLFSPLYILSLSTRPPWPLPKCKNYSARSKTARKMSKRKQTLCTVQ